LAENVKLAILGGGSWGTALAIALAPRFETIWMRVYETYLPEQISKTRENAVYLPGFKLPANVSVTTELAATLEGADIVLCVTPSLHVRDTFERALPLLNPSMTFVIATKGLERDSLKRMSQVLAEVASTRFNPKTAVLSGPTFAQEVAAGQPTAVVVASEDPAIAAHVQNVFSGPKLRLYTNADTIGVELGGALKNVIAIAAGVVDGLGLGNNSMAALITRGLAEITRLAVAVGGKSSTLAGLAGMGDLVLTCTGDLSRNRHVGVELAKGMMLKEILASTLMVAEGVETCQAAVSLGQRCGIELPIIEQMHAVLYHQKPPRQAIQDLMQRALRDE
jgi:glycerol-3-phosphate dehydrogenase (NAD(P)+)